MVSRFFSGGSGVCCLELRGWKACEIHAILSGSGPWPNSRSCRSRSAYRDQARRIEARPELSRYPRNLSFSSEVQGQIGASIIRINFGVFCTIFIIRNPQNSIGNDLGPYFSSLLITFLQCVSSRQAFFLNRRPPKCGKLVREFLYTDSHPGPTLTGIRNLS